ncbi:MAG: PEP-CTERM sorting domain-containing protein [Methylobacteriaceae bacterium]|nr:PEP-CTERM sorting domain-containing protein [Methylobacteriaceae bacterium]
MIRNLVITAAATAFVAAAAVPAQAALSFISGTGNPSSAVAGGQIDFESLPLGSTNSLTVGGVTFSTSGGEALYIDNTYAGAYNTIGKSLQNTYNSNAFGTLNISFATAVAAFAFNYGAADTVWTLDAYDASNTLLGSFNLAPTFGGNAGTFYGVASNGALIASAVLRGDRNDYIFVDNFTGGISSGVPEPSTWAMMLIGFAGLGLLSQRRRAAVAA